jgi:hypothetical protein
MTLGDCLSCHFLPDFFFCSDAIKNLLVDHGKLYINTNPIQLKIYHSTFTVICTLLISSLSFSLSLTFLMNKIDHYLMVACYALSWERLMIMCKYLGSFSKIIWARWLICTRLLMRRRMRTSWPGAKIDWSSRSLKFTFSRSIYGTYAADSSFFLD